MNKYLPFFFLIVSLIGCVPAVLHKPLVHTFDSKKYQFDKIWTATVQAVIEAGFTIEASDKNSRSITTNWNTEGMINLASRGENGFGECRQIFLLTEDTLKIKGQCRITEKIFLGPSLKMIPETETYLTEDQNARLNYILETIKASLR